MRGLLTFILLLSHLVVVGRVEAQVTYAKVVGDRSHVPLYDCEIFAHSRDRNKCHDLRRGENVRWENGGYAVSCYDLGRGRRESCLSLADNIIFDNSRIDCSFLRGDREDQRRCEITKRAYFDGRFYDRGVSRDTHVTTTTVVTNTYSNRTTCDTRAYDRALENWRVRKEEQRKKGQTRAAVGIATTIGGIILGASNDRTAQDIGRGLTVGGVLLTSWGMVEMIDADNSYPHLDPYCRTSWTSETRRVVVERQECMTTRYSEQNRYSSRYYYEVTCQNKRYVTFEEFSPWERGQEVTYYYRY